MADTIKHSKILPLWGVEHIYNASKPCFSTLGPTKGQSGGFPPVHDNLKIQKCH